MKISCILSNSAKTNVFWRKLRQTAWGSFTDLMFGSMCDCVPIYVCVRICVCLCLNIFGCEREINTWSSNSTQNSFSVFVCLSFYADIVSVYLCWSISRWERYMIFFQFNTEPTLRNDSPCAPALLTWDPKLLTDNFFSLLFYFCSICPCLNAIIHKLTPKWHF